MADSEPAAVGRLYVFTFKKGMLARLGHDLRLSLPRFSVTLDGEKVRGVFDATGVHVDGAVVRGRLDPSAPPAMMHGEILSNIADAVLLTGRYPTVEFDGAWDRAARRVEGQLTLVGRTHPLTVPVRLEPGEAVASVELAPSRWGIAPFKALGGTLKVQDRVRVELHLPLPEGPTPTAGRWRGPEGPAS